MKITDEISINPDSLHSVALDKADNTGTFIQIVFDNDDYVHLYNAKEGKGFAEKTKAKIDAYFEIKEKMFSKSLELLEKQLENKNE